MDAVGGQGPAYQLLLASHQKAPYRRVQMVQGKKRDYHSFHERMQAIPEEQNTHPPFDCEGSDISATEG